MCLARAHECRGGLAGGVAIGDGVETTGMRPLADEIRFALLGSPYEAPSVEPGDLLDCACESRRVVVAGLTRALIPCPYPQEDGRLPGGHRPRRAGPGPSRPRPI